MLCLLSFFFKDYEVLVRRSTISSVDADSFVGLLAWRKIVGRYRIDTKQVFQ